MNANDEPAFPVQTVVNSNGDTQWGSDGMSVRDFFFAHALQGLCANPSYMTEMARATNSDVNLMNASMVGAARLLADEAMKQRNTK